MFCLFNWRFVIWMSFIICVLNGYIFSHLIFIKIFVNFFNSSKGRIPIIPSRIWVIIPSQLKLNIFCSLSFLTSFGLFALSELSGLSTTASSICSLSFGKFLDNFMGLNGEVFVGNVLFTFRNILIFITFELQLWLWL